MTAYESHNKYDRTSVPLRFFISLCEQIHTSFNLYKVLSVEATPKMLSWREIGHGDNQKAEINGKSRLFSDSIANKNPFQPEACLQAARSLPGYCDGN